MTTAEQPPAEHRSGRPIRRWEIWLAVAVVAILVAILAWLSLGARSAADEANGSVGKLSDAVAQLSDVLNRRAPTLEYLACRDRAELSFQRAQAEFLVALLDLSELRLAEPPDPAAIARATERVAELRRAYEAATKRVGAVTDPDAPLEDPSLPPRPARCPALPVPGGTS